MRPSKLLKILYISTYIMAGLFIVFGISVVFIIEGVMISYGKDNAVLTRDNINIMKEADSSPFVTRKIYLYNCTNSDEVIYLGHVPIVEEVGPFTYLENITY